jgi:hypothetical protein
MHFAEMFHTFSLLVLLICGKINLFFVYFNFYGMTALGTSKEKTDNAKTIFLDSAINNKNLIWLIVDKRVFKNGHTLIAIQNAEGSDYVLTTYARYPLAVRRNYPHDHELFFKLLEDKEEKCNLSFEAYSINEEQLEILIKEIEKKSKHFVIPALSCFMPLPNTSMILCHCASFAASIIKHNKIGTDPYLLGLQLNCKLNTW